MNRFDDDPVCVALMQIGMFAGIISHLVNMPGMRAGPFPDWLKGMLAKRESRAATASENIWKESETECAFATLNIETITTWVEEGWHHATSLRGQTP